MPRITSTSDTASSKPLPPNGKRIVIAEDDPFIARMYQTKLTAAGFTLALKNNGRDAYEEIKQTHPDLIILDVNMPELTGFEVLAALQGDGYDFSTSPVLILTNSSDAEHQKLAKQYGVDYLVKADLTPSDVLERINSKLGTSPASPPAAAA